MNFTFSPALILDILLLVLVVTTALAYRRKGFLAGLIELVGNLASLAFAWILSGKASPTVFENFFKSGLITSTADTIQKQGTFNITNLLNSFGSFLPEKFVQSITASADAILNSGAPDLAQQIVENIIAPLIVPIITVVVFFATYAVCKLLIAFLVATLTNVNHIPLVGCVNKTLGLVIGAAAGVLNALLVLCLLWAIVAITRDNLPVLNEATLSGSMLYSAFSLYNPFV